MTKIKFIEEFNTEKEIKSALNPIVYSWFKNKFVTFSDSQKSCLVPIHNRMNILLSSGRT